MFVYFLYFQDVFDKAPVLVKKGQVWEQQEIEAVAGIFNDCFDTSKRSVAFDSHLDLVEDGHV